MSMQDCLAATHALRERHNSLTCTVVYIGDEAPYARVDGTIRLDGEQQGVRLVADYELSIVVSEDFPASVPKVRLSDGAPATYPHVDSDGTLCLGVNGEIAMAMNNSAVPLIAFYDEVLLPNIYAIEYYRRYRVMPFGDRSHGSQGVLEFYREFFDVDDESAVCQLLRAAAFRSPYRRRGKCPCGSKLRATHCHANHIDQLRACVDKSILMDDLALVANAANITKIKSARESARLRLKGHRKT